MEDGSAQNGFIEKDHGIEWLKGTRDSIITNIRENWDTLLDLIKCDDWTFLLKAGTLLESSIAALVLARNNEPGLSKHLLELTHSKRCQIAHELELLTTEERQFLRLFSELRNDLAHNREQLNFTFQGYFEGLHNQKKGEWRSVLQKILNNQDVSGLLTSNPKMAICLGVTFVTAGFYVDAGQWQATRELEAVSAADTAQLAKKLLDIIANYNDEARQAPTNLASLTAGDNNSPSMMNSPEEPKMPLDTKEESSAALDRLFENEQRKTEEQRDREREERDRDALIKRLREAKEEVKSTQWPVTSQFSSIRELFTEGACAAFAFVCHQLNGGQVRGSARPCHFWVKVGEQFFDVTGQYSSESLLLGASFPGARLHEIIIRDFHPGALEGQLPAKVSRVVNWHELCRIAETLLQKPRK